MLGIFFIFTETSCNFKKTFVDLLHLHLNLVILRESGESRRDMNRGSYVYILASKKNGTLYIGVDSNSGSSAFAKDGAPVKAHTQCGESPHRDKSHIP